MKAEDLHVGGHEVLSSKQLYGARQIEPCPKSRSNADRPQAHTNDSTSDGADLTILRILFGVIQAVLHSATSAFLLLMSMLLSAVGVLVLVGFLGVGLTGMVSLRLSRRRSGKR